MVSINVWEDRVTAMLGLGAELYEQTGNPAFSESSILRALANGCQRLDPTGRDMMIELNLMEGSVINQELVEAMPDILSRMNLSPQNYYCDVHDCPAALKKSRG